MIFLKTLTFVDNEEISLFIVHVDSQIGVFRTKNPHLILTFVL